VEFLFQPATALFAFLEVNTRLQVEHPITEVTTDTDLVKLQIHVAAGGRLEGERPARRATRSRRASTPRIPTATSPPPRAIIAYLDCPAGPGIRVDTGVAEGDSIPADFDSMIAKIIAYGRDPRRGAGPPAPRHARDHRRHRGRRHQQELRPRPARPARGHRRHAADTGWIDRVRGEGRLVSRDGTRASRWSRPASRPTRRRRSPRAHPPPGDRPRRSPQVQHNVGRPVDLKLRGAAYKVTVLRTGPARFRATVDDGTSVYRVEARLTAPRGRMPRASPSGDKTYRLVTATHGPVHLVEVDGVTHRVSRDEGGVLRSPAPALVVATPVPVGDEVAAGAPVWCWSHEDGDASYRRPSRPASRSCWSPPEARSRPGRRSCAWSRSVTARRRRPPTTPRPG
jgi:acetyl/propionyl-CoA carboxylase alpha subunit